MQRVASSPTLHSLLYGALATHHRGSLVADDLGPLLEGGGIHDAGGGDVQGHHVESQQHTEIQQHHYHLEDWENEAGV